MADVLGISEFDETVFKERIDHIDVLSASEIVFLKSRDDWEFVHIYTDEGISATNTKKREGFKSMIADALAGKIDLIITNIKTRYLIQFHTRGKSLQAFVIWALQGFLRFRKLECDGQYLVKEK